MKITTILTTIIVLTLQLSAVCQDEICLDREVAIRIANKLDTLDFLKKTNSYYIKYKDSCEILTKSQAEIIKTQAFLISSNTNKIELLEEKYNDCESVVVITETMLEAKDKQLKKTKRSLTFSLIGGGVVTLGLTTAILAILL
jgi:hypothetical protein